MNQSKILKHKDDIVLLIENLIKEDEQFNKSLSSSTLTKRNVIYRFDKWISHLSELLEEKESNNDKKFRSKKL
ncbi:hypothetical protein [Bacillus andreraoultii]|uniref:hypothetical protein n=1 Tax=Bacillus andreraoultii TaxID=1499685 RepID=UPI00053962E1|nr:hypothetical protein [Bacillus andreraoultii]